VHPPGTPFNKEAKRTRDRQNSEFTNVIAEKTKCDTAILHRRLFNFAERDPVFKNIIQLVALGLDVTDEDDEPPREDALVPHDQDASLIIDHIKESLGPIILRPACDNEIFYSRVLKNQMNQNHLKSSVSELMRKLIEHKEERLPRRILEDDNESISNDDGQPDPEPFPMLRRYSIPLDKPKVHSALLRDFHKLNKQLTGSSTIHLNLGNRVIYNCVTLPKRSGVNGFRRGNKDTTFLDEIFEGLQPKDASLEDTRRAFLEFIMTDPLCIEMVKEINQEGEVYVVLGNEADLEDATVIHRCNVERWLSGDLKFFMMATCRESGDKWWCFLCHLGKPEWEGKDEPGEEWTNEMMLEHIIWLETLDNPGTYERRGVKTDHILLFDAIDFDHFILPVLHIKLGFVNGIYKNIIFECQAGFEFYTDEYYELEQQLAVAKAEMEDNRASKAQQQTIVTSLRNYLKV
jgi:hypothetical protein